MRGRFTLEIGLANAAMQTPADVSWALRSLADELEAANGAEWDLDSGRVRDGNGNTVGVYVVEGEPDG